MRRPCFLVGLLVVLGVQTSLAVAAPRIGLSAFGGYQAFAMGDINDRIHEVDDALSSPGDLANIDELRGNWTWGGGVKVDLDATWRAYLEYEFLRDDTGFGNTNGQFQLKPSANSVLLGGTYFFPSTNKVRYGLGAGVGYYAFGGSVNSSVTWYTSSVSGSKDLGGNTVGFHGRGELDLTMSPVWHFDAALGYRWAKGTLQVDGSDSPVDLDWSGLMTRLGVTYFVR